MAAEMGPGPDVEHHHHHETGHRWLDVVLGVSAVFISLMSLILAIQHGRAMEKMVEMSSWPYVQLGFSTAKEDGTSRIVVMVQNRGVGPAKVESIEVFYKGVPQTDSKAFIRAMLKVTDPTRPIDVLRSDIVGDVLPARETVNLFDVELSHFSPEEYRTLRNELLNMTNRVCYCSVFDECSVIDSSRGGKPEKVKECPVPKTMFLH
jgi:hypothetical protein